MGPVVAVIHRGVIDLAREPEFTLGEAQVRPPTREVIAPGRREVLQPRVMQVLIVLARRSGEVVSKDELVALCWGGRAVSEDAIHRCIARLRRLSEAFGGFEVETLTRVGYRLFETGAAEPVGPARPSRRRLVTAAAAAGVVVLGAAAAGWYIWSIHRPPAEDESPQVAVQPFKPLAIGPADASLAARVSDGVLSVFQEARIQTSAPGDARHAPWRLGGAVLRDGDVVRARVELDDVSTNVPVWTAEFHRPAGQEEALNAAVGGAASEAIYAAREARQEPGVTVPPKAVAAFIRGYLASTDPEITNLGDPLPAYREMVALAPDSATGHAYLAYGYAFAGFFATGADAARLKAAARQEAVRSIRMNPSAAGAAYGTLSFLDQMDRPHDLLHQEDVILDGLAHAPKFPLGRMGECQFLLKVGRSEAAFAQCQQASGMRPLLPPTNVTYPRAMLQLGQPSQASQYLAHVLLYHPDNSDLRVRQFEIGAFLGPPAAMEAMFQQPLAQYWPGRQPMLLLLHARRTGSPKDAEAAVAALRAAGQRRQIDPRWVVMGAAVLGRLDDAFAATQDDPERLDHDTSYLFEPATAAMRRDPRFWEVAERNGLLSYWKARRVWPDFCSDKTVGVDCAKAAARVSHQG